jgi:hypothetical protein
MLSWYFVIKCAVSGILVGVISEIGRRNPGFGAIIASLPLTSILAFIWIYRESGNPQTIVDLSRGIALIVLPSLVFFILTWFLLKQGWPFYGTLAAACAGLICVYWVYVKALSAIGVQL